MHDLDRFARTSLAAAFAAGARDHPQAMATFVSDHRPGAHSLAALDIQARCIANALRSRGIGRGDVVALQLPGWAEWLVAASAITRLGAVILPVVSIYGARELAFILGQSNAKVIITPDRWRSSDYLAAVRDAGYLPHLATHVAIGDVPNAAQDERLVAWADMLDYAPLDEHAARDPDDIALLIYTSGTTSDPKGVCHTSRTILSELWSVARPFNRDREQCFLSPWPPGHIAGITPLLAFMVTGRKLILLDRWDPVEAARLIARERVTVTSLAPFHIAGLIDALDSTHADLSSLGECSVGAAPVAPALVSRCEDLGLRIFRRYGSTEHPSVTAGTPDDPLEKRLAKQGKPMPGNRIRFVDDAGREVAPGEVGEIVTRGPERFAGYLDQTLDGQAFLPGGWYRTGDMGQLDADGYLVLTDRKKDIIIRGGENISSREVEDVLATHDDIVEAAVVGKPDTKFGERVCAFSVTRSGADLTMAAVQAHFAETGVARQKTPEFLIFVNDLPRNAAGKVIKRDLRLHFDTAIAVT